MLPLRIQQTEFFQVDYFDKVYRVQRPADALAAYVEFYWELDLAQSGGIEIAEHLFAHPFASMVFSSGTAYYQSEEPDTGYTGIHRSKLMGLRSRPVFYRHVAQNKLTGIKFRAGGLYPFVRTQLHELENEALEIDLLFGNDIRGLEDKLYEAGDFHARCSLLNDFLIKRLATQETHAYRKVQQALSLFRSDFERNSTIRSMAGKLSVTTKTLDRYFMEVVGMHPKTCYTILRCREALKQLARGEQRVLDSFGYYDQSHFIHEVKKYTRFSPKAYSRLQGS